jgi:RHS repeat-associated protein
MVHIFENTGDGGYLDLGDPGGFLTDPVFTSDTLYQSSIVRMGDMNGDNFADLVVLQGAAINICLFTGTYQDGTYACTSVSYASLGWPNLNSYIGWPNIGAQGVQIADVDGSGIGRLAVFYGVNQQVYYGLFSVVPGALPGSGTVTHPSGMPPPVRPGLLTTVQAIGGLTTTFTYDYLNDPNQNMQPRVPVPVWFATTMSRTNNLSGSHARTDSVSYSYSTPVYDPRERVFAGFKKVTATNSGVSGGPATTRTTTYLTDTCGAQGVPGSQAVGCVGVSDYSYFHAVRNLPAAVEVSDAATGAHLQTTTYKYSFVSPYQNPIDMRRPLLRYLTQQDDYLWEPTTSQAVTVSNFYPILAQPSPVLQIAIPASGGGSDIRRTTVEDSFGNVTQSTDLGQVGSSDVPIQTVVDMALPPGDTSGWNFRPLSVTTSYAGQGGGRTFIYTYDSVTGKLKTVTGTLSGAQPLMRNNQGNPAAPTPQDAEPLGTTNVLLKQLTYDSSNGNLLTIQTPNGNTPNGRCQTFTYDPLFAHLLYTSTANTSGCNGAGLTTQYSYDRGFGAPVQVSQPGQGTNEELSGALYDAFGRVTTVYQPSDTQYRLAMPALQITYVDDTDAMRETEYQVTDGPWTETYLVEHHRYVDGFGNVLAQIDAAGAAVIPTTNWNVTNATTYYPNGLVHNAYKPFAWTGAATGFANALPTLALTGPALSSSYDALGRTVASSDYSGGQTQYAFHPSTLSVKVTDPEQNCSAPNCTGQHITAYTTVATNGHAQRTLVDHHYGNGPLGQTGDQTTTVAYQATGEPTSITIQGGSGPSYSRTMTYDSLGRMVGNLEPNTNLGDNTGQGGLGWVYAYNVNGELVATSDARGCGENIAHDVLGRVVSEDYSPCSIWGYSPDAAYTPPDGSGDGTEVYNVYDPNSGWLTDTYDRAQHTSFGYDLRGRVDSATRYLAVPSSVATANGRYYLSTRYAAQSFTKSFALSEGGRILSEGTGADPAATDLLGSGGTSQINYQYYLQGVIESVGGSYGTLLSNALVDPSGRVGQQVLGDVAPTTIGATYDANERLKTYAVTRPKIGPWVSYSSAFQSSTYANTLLATLTQSTVLYDGVGNPVSVGDTAPVNGSALGWLPGSYPESRAYIYSDDYRLTSSTSSYNGGTTDSWTTPYTAAETATGSATFPQPSVVAQSTRPWWQKFTYDWLGNMASSSDDQSAFPDRSLGTVVNGAGAGPNCLTSAGSGMLSAYYDLSGNLSDWSWSKEVVSGIHKYPATQDQYYYQWDEVGNLAVATWEGGSQKSAVTKTYTYTGSHERILTEEVANGSTTYSARVFDSLLLSNTSYSTAQGGKFLTSDATHDYEQLFLPGAHVIYDKGGLWPPSGTPQLHVFYDVGDPLGSTSFVIDGATSELVERPTYQPYGQVETDYRTPRWQNYREVIRYTAHEDDAEVGLVYFGARYYVPQLARWASPDPLTIHALASDSNPYAFVRGGPVGRVDLNGLSDTGSGAGGDPPPVVDGNTTTFGQSNELLVGMVTIYGTLPPAPCAGDCVSDTPVPTDGDPFANSIDYGFLLDTTSLGSRPAFSEAYDAGWDAAASEGNQQALNLVGIFLAATGAVEVGGPADNSVSSYLYRASDSLPPFVRWATALAAIEFTAGSGVFGQVAKATTAAEGLGGAASTAARFATTAERAGVLEKVLTSDGALNTSQTVARQLGGQRGFIPVQSILDTIGSGARIADPQGVAGQFMYRASAAFNGSAGTLEVLVEEASGQINHVLFRSGVSP